MNVKINNCRLFLKTVYAFVFLGIGFAYADNLNNNFVPLYRGVSYRLLEKNDGNLKVHQIKIDAEDSDVEIFTTAPNDNGHETSASKPSTFLRKEKAQVVMNGTGYRPANLQAEGMPKAPESMAIYKGVQYAQAQGENAAFIVLNDGTKKIVKREELAGYEGSISMAIGAWPWAGVQGLLIDDGVSCVPNFLKDDQVTGRSALGISADGKSLYLVVVQGRPRNESIFKELITDGVSLNGLVDIMFELGCYRAMNLDGGGSSTLVVENIINASPLVLNVPSDLKGERAVGSHLGVRAPYIPSYEIEEKVQLKTFRVIQENSIFFDLLTKNEGVLVDMYMDAATRVRLDIADITSLDKLYSRFGIPQYLDFNRAYDALLDAQKIEFNECFPKDKKYSFECGNPKEFFNKLDIKTNDHIMSFSELKLVGKKEAGVTKGGVYKDSKNAFYFVKHAQFVKNELIGSRLLNLIIGTETTSVVKLLKDNPKMTASRMIRGFTMANDFVKGHKRVIGEVDLNVAMDFIGLIDRHKWNMGYVQVKHKNDAIDRKLGYAETYTAARVDYDHSFSFSSDPHKSPTFMDDPLCLKQIWSTFSKQENPSKGVIGAMRKIVAIPDSQIVMTIFECWVALSEIGESFTMEQAFDLASKLIERKKAFKRVLNEVEQLNKRKVKDKVKMTFVRDLSEIYSFQESAFKLQEIKGANKISVLMNDVQVAEFVVNDETLKNSYNFLHNNMIYTINLDKIRIDKRNFVWIDNMAVEEEAKKVKEQQRIAENAKSETERLTNAESARNAASIAANAAKQAQLLASQIPHNADAAEAARLAGLAAVRAAEVARLAEVAAVDKAAEIAKAQKSAQEKSARRRARHR